MLHGALGEREDGKWAAFEVGLIVPRQNGKGSILEARELAGLFLFGEQLILHSAHEFKTAAEAFRRLLFLVENTPELAGRVAKVRTSHGDEGIELKSGQRVRFVARSTGSGRGFSGDTVILDEAYNLPGAALEALMPTMAARSVTGNPQIWYPSSAPLPREESDTLRRLCKRGREGAERLAFFEWCSDGALDDEATWEEANPGFGIRISAEFIRSERAAMSEEGFARERCGIWRDIDKPGVIHPDDWEACTTPTELADPVVLAVDITPDRAASALAAGSDNNLELIDHQPGTGWLVQRTIDVYQAHKAWGVVVDPAGPAGSLTPELEQAGLNVILCGSGDYKAACVGFYDTVKEHGLTCPPHPALDAAVAGAGSRNLGETWVWARRGDTDICPLVAVTLALWGARQPKPQPQKMARPRAVML